MINAPLSTESMAARTDTDFLDVLLSCSGHSSAWGAPLPWSVTREGATLQLRLQALREEILHDPANREVVMACGAVLENLRIAARHLGRELLVSRWPRGADDSVVASMTLGAAVEPRHEEDVLFEVMAREAGAAAPSAMRRGVSPALLAVLRHAARAEGGWLDVVADDARRELMGDLESQAVTIGDAERGARSMLALRLAPQRATPGALGVAVGGAPPLADWLSSLGASVREENGWGVNRAAMARGSTVTAPILGILGASIDAPPGWLDAGAALQRVLLHAKAQGLTATFLNEPLHHPLLRDALRTMLFAGGAPQAIVRFDFDMRGRQPERPPHGARGRTAA